MLEEQIEKFLIEDLRDNLKYIYRDDIQDKKDLEKNFRKKFEDLNCVKLEDNEFEHLMEKIITSDVYNASQILRQTNTLERNDGTPLHYTLVNIKDWCKNTFEVAHQIRINTNNSHHRYDVFLLINGVPIVQIELKSCKIQPRLAIQQIVTYKNDRGNGYSKTLMCFLQLFIVSNYNDTWYFANNSNKHFIFDADERFLPIYQFANKANKKITCLKDFAKDFLAKCILGQMINRYMVLVASEQKLLMMRPYQIYAVKAIVDCIHQNCGNGYIWHTTGSGKTLTSFKASVLMKDNTDIEKCLFIVDRKDLDRQTREEFNRFQEGCVEENTNTKALVERLISDNYADKVIVATIQKLGLALNEKNIRKYNYKKRLEPLRNKRIVFIFDECHRSQFGENHKVIKNFFLKAQFFGFTGTPIFEENAIYQQVDKHEKASLKTTKDIFKKLLHSYTITHAIEDRNVLRFHLDYYKPQEKDTTTKKSIIEKILEKHNIATAERKFNSILATARINDAIEYFELFKKIQTNRKKENEEFEQLNIACVFSPPAEGNKDIEQMQEDLDQEKEDNAVDPNKKKEALKSIIEDYNKKYNTNHSIGEFDLYYQDIQKRIKDQQYNNKELSRSEKIDIVIVVDMLLTGFDSKYLNVLYVDKHLKHHGLIQALSRTNRVLNDTKPYGNILDFRQQQDAVDEAIKMFSGEDDKTIAKEIWIVEPASDIIEKLADKLAEQDTFMQSQGLENKPENVPNLKGDIARKKFINCFKEVQRLKFKLDQYTDLSDTQKEEINNLIPKDTLNGFKGVYLGIVNRMKEKKGKDINTSSQESEDVDFELMLFNSEIIDYDYIMKLISGYSKSTTDKEEMTREQVINLISTDSKFVNEKEDIKAYIYTLKKGEGLSEDEIHEGYENFKTQKIKTELEQIAKDKNLDSVQLQEFIDLTLRWMIFDDEKLGDLFEHLDLGWKERGKKKEDLMKILIPLLTERSKGREISGLDVYYE